MRDFPRPSISEFFNDIGKERSFLHDYAGPRKEKAARRRLINSNMTMLHQAAINAAFDFQR
jgi:hypothetical protein